MEEEEESEEQQARMEPASRQKTVPTQPTYREKPNDMMPCSWWAPMGNHTVETRPQRPAETSESSSQTGLNIETGRWGWGVSKCGGGIGAAAN